MGTCRIRPVGPADAERLADIARRTFEATFAEGNTPDDLTTYVEQAFSVGRVLDEMHTSGSQFFFAENDGELLGYLKVNTGNAQTEAVQGASLEIERIYVNDEQQGRGVGKALLDFAVKEARRQGCDAVWLGVWEKNPKAIQFYERQGFVPFGSHLFQIGSDDQTDILMRLPLKCANPGGD